MTNVKHVAPEKEISGEGRHADASCPSPVQWTGSLPRLTDQEYQALEPLETVLTSAIENCYRALSELRQIGDGEIAESLGFDEALIDKGFVWVSAYLDHALAGLRAWRGQAKEDS